MSRLVNQDLRKKNNEELTNIVTELKTKLLEIRFSVASGETSQLNKSKEIKKTIARVLTILNERAREESQDGKK